MFQFIWEIETKRNFVFKSAPLLTLEKRFSSGFKKKFKKFYKKNPQFLLTKATDKNIDRCRLKNKKNNFFFISCFTFLNPHSLILNPHSSFPMPHSSAVLILYSSISNPHSFILHFSILIP